MSAEQDATPVARPLLTVVRGEPTPEQLAALTAVLAARSAGGVGDAPAPDRPLWARPQLRTPLSPGRGAWRASGLPH